MKKIFVLTTNLRISIMEGGGIPSDAALSLKSYRRIRRWRNSYIRLTRHQRKREKPRFNNSADITPIVLIF